jgi:transcriptional regulator with XRE-family HTH domain
MPENVANNATIFNVANMEKDNLTNNRYALGMLSEWLQTALNDSGVSQSELARLLTERLARSIDRAAVNKMLKGSRTISGEELLAIEAITGITAPKEIHVPLAWRERSAQERPSWQSTMVAMIPLKHPPMLGTAPWPSKCREVLCSSSTKREPFYTIRNCFLPQIS